MNKGLFCVMGSSFVHFVPEKNFWIQWINYWIQLDFKKGMPLPANNMQSYIVQESKTALCENEPKWIQIAACASWNFHLTNLIDALCWNISWWIETDPMSQFMKNTAFKVTITKILLPDNMSCKTECEIIYLRLRCSLLLTLPLQKNYVLGINGIKSKIPRIKTIWERHWVL